jgi:hypothetical protein
MKNYQWMAVALVLAVSLAACKKKEEPVAAAPEPVVTTPAPAPAAPVAATVSVTSVTLGNSLAADGISIATASNAFSSKDKSIHAAVATSTSDPAAMVNGKLTAKWTYQDGQTVHEEPKDLAFTGTGSNVFTISKPDGWPVGKYKVEISLDGAVVQTQEFEVK